MQSADAISKLISARHLPDDRPSHSLEAGILVTTTRPGYKTPVTRCAATTHIGLTPGSLPSMVTASHWYVSTLLR